MNSITSTDEMLRAENTELRARLEEAEEMLRAIRAGEVDALVVETAAGPKLFTFRPDVVLCDIGLPKLNGYEACRRMKEQAWDKKMILIAVTGWGQNEDRRKSSEAGFDYHRLARASRS